MKTFILLVLCFTLTSCEPKARKIAQDYAEKGDYIKAIEIDPNFAFAYYLRAEKQ